MKIILAIAALALTGCSSLPSILERGIPDGKWAKMEATINGKFSSTIVQGSDVEKTGKTITAKDLYVRHSNAWMPLVEFRGTGFLAPQPPTTPP